MNLANFLAKILKDLNITNPQTSNQIHERMKSLLGDNWFVLPVNSFTTLAVVLVLNFVLTPRDITPSSIYQSVITELSKLSEGDVIEKIKTTLNQYLANQSLPMVSQMKQLLEKFQVKVKGKGKTMDQIIHDFLTLLNSRDNKETGEKT